MSEPVLTRAELLARIKASSKDAVVLAEMQRLGFWPAATAAPTLESALIQRETELQQALDGLRADLQVKGDPAAALLAMRKQRMADARERREATAQAREQRRYERALRWHAQRESSLGYLGAGVSAGLQAPPAAAKKAPLLPGLPVLESPLALAQAMGLSLAELKFLSFHREVARTSHYRRFMVDKKSGGQRCISAPMPRLKRAQYWVLDKLLAQVPCHAAVHGFMPGRSIVSNAAPHCGQAVVINLDLKDFFPSIGFGRIKGVFQGLGYNEPVATVLALLCSENVCDELVVDGERYFVGGKGRDRRLPQGAPTSPMLTNILCRKLDRRLQGLATKLGFTYTRYADDLSFSAPPESAALVGRLLRQVHHVVEDEGFTPHPDKQRVMRHSQRQEVTGVVVNQQPAVSRTERRRLRAALHRAQQKGLATTTWHDQPASREVLVGMARYVHMVNPRQGAGLLTQALGLPGPAAAGRSSFGANFRRQAALGQPPQLARGGWWQVTPPPAPVLAQTAGQIKAARQAKIQAKREARQAAARPAALPHHPSGPSGPANHTHGQGDIGASAPQEPLQWVRMLTQVLIAISAARFTHNALVFMLGAPWAGYLLMTRKNTWPRFGLGMLLIVLLGLVLR